VEGDEHMTKSVDRTSSGVTYRRTRGSTEFQPERADLTMTSEETWTISVDNDDPASTRVRSDAEVGMGRPGWAVTTRGSLELSSDAGFFHLEIHLTALHGDAVVFSKTWTEHIPREWA
jgi:hypothetical protein